MQLPHNLGCHLYEAAPCNVRPNNYVSNGSNWWLPHIYMQWDRLPNVCIVNVVNIKHAITLHSVFVTQDEMSTFRMYNKYPINVMFCITWNFVKRMKWFSWIDILIAILMTIFVIVVVTDHWFKFFKTQMKTKICQCKHHTGQCKSL